MPGKSCGTKCCRQMQSCHAMTMAMWAAALLAAAHLQRWCTLHTPCQLQNLTHYARMNLVCSCWLWRRVPSARHQGVCSHPALCMHVSALCMHVPLTNCTAFRASCHKGRTGAEGCAAGAICRADLARAGEHPDRGWGSRAHNAPAEHHQRA